MLAQTVLGKHVDGVTDELAGDVPSSTIWSSMSDNWSVKVDVTVPGGL